MGSQPTCLYSCCTNGRSPASPSTFTLGAEEAPGTRPPPQQSESPTQTGGGNTVPSARVPRPSFLPHSLGLYSSTARPPSSGPDGHTGLGSATTPGPGLSLWQCSELLTHRGQTPRGQHPGGSRLGTEPLQPSAQQPGLCPALTRPSSEPAPPPQTPGPLARTQPQHSRPNREEQGHARGLPQHLAHSVGSRPAGHDRNSILSPYS